ncbi:hypothetical protein [Comamonas sp.]|uniref:hypothetical protein n=1 Tax=Comamonas sp. TaxID=34028 RepID=UPI0028AFC30F|nr:hypothetical protein [Comamonas sp.]
MAEVIHKLSSVFGISRKIPLTYQHRKYVDGKLKDNLYREKHIVIYGGSKQGKTCLRKHSLKDEEYIVVQCSNATLISQIYSSVLKEAGATIDISEKSTLKGEKKLKVEVKTGISIPFVSSTQAGGGYDHGSATENSSEKRHFEIDPSDPNDVIRVLDGIDFKKFIVLEDFHYLSEEVQKQVAMDLKAFHEKSSLSFIVVGVWLESNRLVMYNGDLAGRLIPIDADNWEANDLEEIINSGESLLNVTFSDEVKKAMLDAAQGNVGILQEASYRLCEDAGILETQSKFCQLNNPSAVNVIVSELAREQAGRYQNFLTQFVEGIAKSDLEMYKWLMYIVIDSNAVELRAGLKAFEIFTRMQRVHPYRERLRYNNTLQALRNVGKLQHLKRVQPVILDFDSTENVLRIVDSGFTLFLTAQDKQMLKDQIGLGVLPPRAPESEVSPAQLDFDSFGENSNPG